ncbi:hypothetical protein PZH32_12900, partial [Adlercreutzia equolifaciens]|uniref:hypothetical protein n=1 Tax=Adlercreutzia equolifaciens TaxID=446660 RepID=UPI0023B1E551
MLYDERTLRHDQALDIAQKMLEAARTAPKGKGIDVIECAVVDGDEQEALACAMRASAKSAATSSFCATRAACARASAWCWWARA